MNKNTISLPESVRLYFSKPAIRSAVNYLLTIKKKQEEFPVGLNWGEMEEYHRAFLSAQQTKSEYCMAMMYLWDRTWGQALDSSNQRSIMSFSDAKYPAYQLPSPSNIWKYGFYKILKTGEKLEEWLVTFTWIDEEAGIAIGFYYDDVDSTYQKSDDLTLPDPWMQSAIDSERHVYLELGDADEEKTLSDASEVDVFDLITAAKEAIKRLDLR